jgi:hypothetical protein
MITELIRLEEGPEGTFGILKLDKRIFCATLELRDELNRPNCSCIPGPQQYLCKRRLTRHGETFEVMDVPGRSGILFHSGNFLGDTQGCILLGQYIDQLRGERAVLNSGRTMEKFIKKTKNVDKFLLTVLYSL